MDLIKRLDTIKWNKIWVPFKALGIPDRKEISELVSDERGKE